jgi:Domain of unknown function (DUF4383)
MRRTEGVTRTKGVSLAKGPVGIIGLVLLAGGILGLLFGSTNFTTHAPSGDVSGGTWLGIEGNGWTWLAFAVAGVVLLMSAPMHWGAKTMSMILGIIFVAACVIAAIDGNDVFGVAAANTATMAVWGIAGAVLLVLAMLPRVGRRRDVVVEDDRAATTGTGRFGRRRDRTAEPVGTTERRV